jgi:phage baseplate assembly protein gpV
MKTKIQILGLAALLPAAMLALTSCSSTESQIEPPATMAASKTVAFEPGVPGGVMVEKFKESATVTAIDPATRKVTLVKTDGTKTSFVAGPEVANFAQLAVGDQVKATVTDRGSLFVPKAGESAADLAAGVLALAPLGEKPGGVMADTVQFTAKVTAVSLWHHTATLQLPDGSSKTFKVRPDVTLTKDTVGTEVVIRTTQAIAVSVEKP